MSVGPGRRFERIGRTFERKRTHERAHTLGQFERQDHHPKTAHTKRVGVGGRGRKEMWGKEGREEESVDSAVHSKTVKSCIPLLTFKKKLKCTLHTALYLNDTELGYFSNVNLSRRI